jgi:hypothetical protein
MGTNAPSGYRLQATGSTRCFKVLLSGPTVGQGANKFGNRVLGGGHVDP